MMTDYNTLIENEIDILTNFMQSSLDELTKIGEILSEMRDTQQQRIE